MPPERLSSCVGVAALVVTAYVLHLGAALWNDEAETMFVARSIVAGKLAPTLDDGRTALVFHDCAQVTSELVSKTLPWLQYYVGAASLALFGSSETGMRLLFVLLGASALLPLLLLLRPYYGRAAPFLAGAILLSPQVVLYQRNARYFPLLIAEYAWLLAILFVDRLGERRRRVLLALVFVLLFHTHPVVAAAAWLSNTLRLGWLAARVRSRRRETLVLWLCSCAGPASWALWSVALGPTVSSEFARLDLLLADPVRWCRLGWRSLIMLVQQLDLIGLAPVPLALTAAVFCAIRLTRRRTLDPVAIFILLNLALLLVFDAFCVGEDTMRYLCPFAVGTTLAWLLLFREVLVKSRLAQAGAALLFATNVLAVGFWLDNAVLCPWSWWPRVYGEVLDPPADSMKELIERVRSFAPPGSVVDVQPSWLDPVFGFYLGDQFVIRPRLPLAPACAAAVERVVGHPRFELMTKKSDVDVYFVQALDGPQNRPGYEQVSTPFNRSNADGLRPELNRHRFAVPESFLAVVSRRPK